MLAAGVDEAEQALIRNVLDSYQHTNALALVVLSALLAHYEPQPADAVAPAGVAPKPSGARIPELPPMDALDPEVAALVGELNTFGEDTEPKLIASMYRHLGVLASHIWRWCAPCWRRCSGRDGSTRSPNRPARSGMPMAPCSRGN